MVLSTSEAEGNDVTGKKWQQRNLSLDCLLSWMWGCKHNQHFFLTKLDKLPHFYDLLDMFLEERGLSWINPVEDTETSMETSTGKGILPSPMSSVWMQFQTVHDPQA